MSQSKTTVVSVGHGTIKDSLSTSRIFTSSAIPVIWNSATAYAKYNCVEYDSGVWRCQVANTNSAPALDNPNWAQIFHNPTNGDVCIVTDSADSSCDLFIRNKGMWVSAGTNAPKVAILTDGQATPTEIFRYAGASLTGAWIVYALTRGNGDKELGTLKIMNDGVSTLTTANDFMLFQSSPKISLSASMSGGDVIVSYTSESTSAVPYILYDIKGW